MAVGLDHLEAFIAAAKEGSQDKAAKLIGCRQSTISKRIAALEEWLGTLLLTSDAPKELTNNGKSFLPIAEEVVTLLEQARCQPSASVLPPKISAKDIQV